MGGSPLNCQNDDTPHRFPSQGTALAALREIVDAPVSVLGDTVASASAMKDIARRAIAADSEPADRPRRYPSHGDGYDPRTDWPERYRDGGPI